MGACTRCPFYVNLLQSRTFKSKSWVVPPCSIMPAFYIHAVVKNAWKLFWYKSYLFKWLSGPCKCLVRWTDWVSVGNTTLKPYLEKDPVAKPILIYIISITSLAVIFCYDTRTFECFLRELFLFLIHFLRVFFENCIFLKISIKILKRPCKDI